MGSGEAARSTRYSVAARVCGCATAVVLAYNVYCIFFDEDIVHWECMLSMISDLLWVAATGQLLQRLLWSTGGARSAHWDLCRAFSLQTLFSYTMLYAMKVWNRKFWRWHELPDAGWSADRAILLALCGASAIVASSQLTEVTTNMAGNAHCDNVPTASASSSLAAWFMSEALGHEAVEYCSALHKQKSGAFAWAFAALSWSLFYAACALAAMLFYVMQPRNVTKLDKRDGIRHPGVVCYLQALDALAMLPQFVKMLRPAPASAGQSRISLAGLPRTLVDFMVGLALSRLSAVADSLPGLYRSYFYGGRVMDEVFYLTGNALDLLVLSDFFFYYVRARLKAARETWEWHVL